MTAQTAVGFVIFASLMLMVLYFFLNHVFAIVLVSIPTLASLIPASHARGLNVQTAPHDRKVLTFFMSCMTCTCGAIMCERHAAMRRALCLAILWLLTEILCSTADGVLMVAH